MVTKVKYCVARSGHICGTIAPGKKVIEAYIFNEKFSAPQMQIRFKRCVQYIKKYVEGNDIKKVKFPHHPQFSNILRTYNYNWIRYEKLTYQDCDISEYIKRYMKTGVWSEFFERTLDNDDVMEGISAVDVYAKKQQIYPPIDKVFNAFTLSPTLPKVIIIGQDPYHNEGAAMGLAFGHDPSYHKIQPSLKNIFKEMETCGYTTNDNGDLSKWVEQGVFLINTALTVEESKPDSHTKEWEMFTRHLFMYLSQKCEHLVVVMWGRKAQNFSTLFNTHKHHLIKSSHPSPFSVANFFGTKPFDKVNQQLRLWKLEEIDWNL